MKKLLLLFLFAIATVITSGAQVNELSDQDLQALKDREGEVIDMFQNNLNILTSKKYSLKVKSVFMKSALKLFIGEGLPYDEPGTGTKYPGVQVQVISIINDTESKQNIPLTTYLENLIKLPYAEVKLTAADIYRIGNVYKVGDHYEANATLFQRFEGYTGKDMKKKYVDVIQKNIRIYIVPENDLAQGVNWRVLLGNIGVVETQ